MKKSNGKKIKINFTKLTRAGISLIVLVITIILIVILASSIILSISNNNPVREANIARYNSDVANMQAIFTNVVVKVMAQNKSTMSIIPGQINTVIKDENEVRGEVSYIVENAENINNTNGIIIFDKGTSNEKEFYTGRKLPIYAAGETKWYVDSEGNISLEVAGVKYGNGVIPESETSGEYFSKTVADNATKYYGEDVLNYNTGITDIDNQVQWQIFYANESNIYLIASDYVHYDLLPKKKIIDSNGVETEYSLTKIDDYSMYLTGVLPAYSGSANITSLKLKKLNSKFFEYINSQNIVSEINSMKAVAYMLDIDIWDSFAGENAEYAIGAPTIEMLLESYTQKYGVDYRARVVEEYGYDISKNGGIDWNNYYNEMLNANDTQYVISVSNRKASGMWIASPSSFGKNFLMNVNYSGRIRDWGHYGNNNQFGFRPVVCLNSSVTLKETENGYTIE